MKLHHNHHDRAERRAHIDFARGSVRLEGYVLTPATEAIAQRYIEGEVTLDDFVKAVEEQATNHKPA